MLSHERLVLAGSAQAERAVRSLEPRRLTIVITARDLARQVASSWQQQVKQRFRGPLAEFAADVLERAPAAEEFWRQQDVLAAVDTWLEHVPVGQVVLVTVPSSGERPELFWERFVYACGIDPSGFDLDVATRTSRSAPPRSSCSGA